jgi:hypothetical protein
VPDWKDAATYGYTKSYTKSLHFHCWAWEFLRRNPEYRKDFQHWCSIRAEVESKHGPISRLSRNQRSKIAELLHYSPPRCAGEDDQAWYQRCFAENVDPWKLALNVALGRKWGLYDLYDPDSHDCRHVKFRPRRTVLVTTSLEQVVEDAMVLKTFDGIGAASGQAKRGRRNVYARIDLSRDLSPQLGQVKREVAALQKLMRRESGLAVKITKAFSKNWQSYLRVLDARSSNAKWKEIAKCLFPKTVDKYPELKGQRKARDTFKQALKISAEGYRTLVP